LALLFMGHAAVMQARRLEVIIFSSSQRMDFDICFVCVTILVLRSPYVI
jgi:hypothetical protein